MTIFSLFCVFLSTMSWFQVVRNVKTDLRGFEILNQSGILKKVEIYQIDSSKNGYFFLEDPSITYTYEKGKTTKEGERSLSLGTYDSLLEREYALLYVIEIDPSLLNGDKVTLSISTSTTDKEGLLYKEEGVYVNPLKKEEGENIPSSNKMSSFVKFTSRAGSNKTTVKQVSGTASFTRLYDKKSTDTNYKYQTVEYSYPNGTSSLDKSKPYYIQLVISYDDTLLEEILDVNSDNEDIWSFDYDNTIKFCCDFLIQVQ